MAPDLETQFANEWPPTQWQDVTVLLAVSGGSDSVAMLRAMKSLSPAGPGSLVVAHFNHGLRAEESDGDEAFVVDLCRRHEIPCEVGRMSPQTKLDRGGEGLEAAAREVRYDFLIRTAARLGARYVATGHTADDQVETILHHILRGTGIAGLAGMARCRRLSEATTLLRPMLQIRRADLTRYLNEIDQPYRTDSSNTDTTLTRNRLRHELLPLLSSHFNPTVDEALLRLGALAGEVQEVVDRLVDELTEQAVDERAGVVTVDSRRLRDEPRYLLRELIIHAWRRRGWPMQAMGFAEWDALAAMLLGQGSDKRILPGSVIAERPDERLTLHREDEANENRQE